MSDARQQTHNSLAAGLCADCLHSRRIESAHGSVFILCNLYLTDPRYPKYLVSRALLRRLQKEVLTLIRRLTILISI